MGRIRTHFVKGVAQRLVDAYPNKFTRDFTMNKAAIDELKITDEKFTRNKVAGYICCVVKKKKF